MTQIIFINGAPRSGKDTIAQIITASYESAYRIGFADHLKRATHAAYGMFDFPPAYFELCKDEPNALFFGLSPRQAYIKHSEDYFKPAHGKEIFGELWVRAARHVEGARIFAIPDSGFSDEATPAINYYGAENCLLLRVTRPGCDFSSDSRSHITLGDVQMHVIANTGTLELLRRKVLKVLDDFIL